MKRRLSTLLLALVAMVHGLDAQQPYGGCMHPEHLIRWQGGQDTNDKFNRSTVPLQPRFYDDGIKANVHQAYDGKVAACLTMNPMCSMTPSQGDNNFIGYNPTYWQYLDILVWWGGSAGEGIIVPPSAPVVDIAHLNGVKVLGCVFFPEIAHGGNPIWTTQMLTRENNQYPYARKLVDMAEYYGFDGWFINAEGGAQSNNWEGFCRDFIEYARSKGLTHMELQYYNQGTSVSNIIPVLSLQGVSFMANYGSDSPSVIQSNRQRLLNEGMDNATIFAKLYSGIEVAQAGLYGNGSTIHNVFPTTGHLTSLQLFNPEEPIWKKPVQSLLGTDNSRGNTAYNAINTVFNNEARYWVNHAMDPSSTTRNTNTWSGLAPAVQERSAITKVPFVTSFGTGLGKHRFVNGERRGTHDWYHRGMQDILPTWRWWVTTEGGLGSRSNLNFSISWDESYNSGSCISITGNLSANTKYTVRLYKTKLPMTGREELTFVYKGADPKVVLATSDAPATLTSYELTNKTTSNGWTIGKVDLTALSGKTLAIIGLELSSATATSANLKLGQLSVTAKNYRPTASPVTNFAAQNSLQEVTSDIRLTWDRPSNHADIHHYNIYQLIDGQKVLVGQTRNEGFYIPKFTRKSGATNEKVYITSVGQDRKEGSEQELTLSYPSLTISEVSISASSTLVSAGTQVTLTARATKNPTAYEWILPTGATLVSQSGNTAVVTFAQKGRYTIGVKVTNPAGVATAQIENFIEVDDNQALTNVARNKTIVNQSGFTNNSEHPRNLVDGQTIPGRVSAKWCAGGSKEHWVVIDLQAFYTLYQFKFFDCRHKEEFENVENYKIQVSSNGRDWTEVVHEQDRPQSENTKDVWIKPTVGRYVRFIPYHKERQIIIRIWEFEAYGRELRSDYTLTDFGAQNIEVNTSKTFDGTYSLGSSSRSADFDLSVSSADTKIATVKDVIVNNNGTYRFTLEAKHAGKTSITTRLMNNGIEQVSEMQVTIQDPNRINLVLNKVPIVNLDPNYEGYDIVPNTVRTAENISDGKTDVSYIFPYGYNEITHNFVYDLGEEKEFTEMACTTLQHNDLTSIKALRIYTSPDGEAYTLGYEFNNASELYKISKVFDQALSGRFVKIEITSKAYFAPAISEFELYGSAKRAVAKRRITLTPTEQGTVEVVGISDLTAVEEGKEITISAVAKDGYYIKNLLIDGQKAYSNDFDVDHIELIHKLNVTGDHVITVLFAHSPISVYLDDEMENGTVTLSGLSLENNQGILGDEVIVTAHPAPGYEVEYIRIVNYNLEITDITKTKRFTLSEDVVLQAKFRQVTGIYSPAHAGIHLYPNPASTYLHIEGAAGLEVTLYSLTGVRLFVTTADAKERIELPALPTGDYVVSVGNRSAKVHIK